MPDDGFFPDLPPRPPDSTLGTFITHFTADVPTSRIDTKSGRLILNVMVDDADKYQAMPVTDLRGRRFHVLIYAVEGHTPVVTNGRLRVHDAQKRKKRREMDRLWAKVCAEHFTGTTDDD